MEPLPVFDGNGGGGREVNDIQNDLQGLQEPRDGGYISIHLHVPSDRWNHQVQAEAEAICTVPCDKAVAFQWPSFNGRCHVSSRR